MQLSRFSDYSMRTLFYVANNTEQLSTLAEIAHFYDISVDHLRKVVHSLSKAGYLKTYRGKNGGIELARPPKEINIGAVISHSEGLSPLVDCFSQGCRINNVCSFQHVLAEAQGAFIHTLQQYTLADLMKNPALKETLIVSQK